MLLTNLAVMKWFLSFMMLMLLCSFGAADAAPIELDWHVVIALLAGIYEVVIRLIPTVGNYSAIGKVIEILKWLSDFFNKKRK
jgi:hypothetical protein